MEGCGGVGEGWLAGLGGIVIGIEGRGGVGGVGRGGEAGRVGDERAGEGLKSAPLSCTRLF